MYEGEAGERAENAGEAAASENMAGDMAGERPGLNPAAPLGRCSGLKAPMGLRRGKRITPLPSDKQRMGGGFSDPPPPQANSKGGQFRRERAVVLAVDSFLQSGGGGSEPSTSLETGCAGVRLFSPTEKPPVFTINFWWANRRGG